MEETGHAQVQLAGDVRPTALGLLLRGACLQHLVHYRISHKISGEWEGEGLQLFFCNLNLLFPFPGFAQLVSIHQVPCEYNRPDSHPELLHGRGPADGRATRTTGSLFDNPHPAIV